jgi:hypothetical protein
MMPALQSALVRVLAAWLAGGALLAGAAGLDAVRADEGYFIGDSIAAATAQTIGMRGSAHHSVSLRRNAIAPQFLQVPKGAVALMTLGLNDAAIPVSAMHKDIETVIEGAQRTGERIVWIGPPCVLKSWDNRAREMDDYLRRRLATSTSACATRRSAGLACARATANTSRTPATATSGRRSSATRASPRRWSYRSRGR